MESRAVSGQVFDQYGAFTAHRALLMIIVCILHAADQDRCYGCHRVGENSDRDQGRFNSICGLKCSSDHIIQVLEKFDTHEIAMIGRAISEKVSSPEH